MVEFTPTTIKFIDMPFDLSWKDEGELQKTYILYIDEIEVKRATYNEFMGQQILFQGVNLNNFNIGSYPIRVEGLNTTLPYNKSGNIDIEVTCFLEGTEILCLIDNEEKYIKIEDINNDTMIKTYKHGYKKLLYKSHQKVRNNIVCMKKDSLDTNIPFNDLKVTTGHSMLLDNLTDDEITEIEKWNPVKKIDDKFLILSRVSKYFEEYDTKELNNVYHLILEADDLDTQYGIYANGVLMESMSKRFLIF